jgi:hypothetical protein
MDFAHLQKLPGEAEVDLGRLRMEPAAKLHVAVTALIGGRLKG